MQSTNQAKKCMFTVGTTLLYLGEMRSPKLLYTSMDKTYGTERRLPLLCIFVANIDFEHRRKGLHYKAVY